jgi:hypothetical protein
MTGTKMTDTQRDNEDRCQECWRVIGHADWCRRLPELDEKTLLDRFFAVAFDKEHGDPYDDDEYEDLLDECMRRGHSLDDLGVY